MFTVQCVNHLTTSHSRQNHTRGVFLIITKFQSCPIVGKLHITLHHRVQQQFIGLANTATKEGDWAFIDWKSFFAAAFRKYCTVYANPTLNAFHWTESRPYLPPRTYHTQTHWQTHSILACSVSQTRPKSITIGTPNDCAHITDACSTYRFWDRPFLEVLHIHGVCAVMEGDTNG